MLINASIFLQRIVSIESNLTIVSVKYKDLKFYSTITAKFPSNQRLLGAWYNVKDVVASKALQNERRRREGKNANDEEHEEEQRRKKERNDALRRIYDLIWMDDFYRCYDEIYDVVDFLFGWKEDRVLSKADYAFYFPYWSVTTDALTIGTIREYLTLLVRVNFAMAARDKEMKYLDSLPHIGTGTRGMGCFYDYGAFVNLNSSDPKYSRRKYDIDFSNEFGQRGYRRNIPTSLKNNRSTTEDVVVDDDTIESAIESAIDVKLESESTNVDSTTDFDFPFICIDGNDDEGNGKKRHYDSDSEDFGESTSVVSLRSKRGQRRGRRVLASQRGRGKGRGGGDTTRKAPTRGKGRTSSAIRSRGRGREVATTTNATDVREIDTSIVWEKDDPTSGDRLFYVKSTVDPSTIECARVDLSTVPALTTAETWQLQQWHDAELIEEHNNDIYVAKKALLDAVDNNGTIDPECIVSKTNNETSRSNVRTYYDDSAFSNIIDGSKSLVNCSHRLFKLAVFLNAHYKACRYFNVKCTKKRSRAYAFGDNGSCARIKVPLRRCELDKTFVAIDKKRFQWLQPLKTSLKRYQSLVFFKAIRNDDWDDFYLDDILNVYEFIKTYRYDDLARHVVAVDARHDAPLDVTYRRRAKRIHDTIANTNNVELLYAFGIGYGKPRPSEDGPYLYDVKSWERIDVFESDRSLMMTVLYVICACERVFSIVKRKYPLSLTHPSKVIEWFGTSTSKSGAFPAFTDSASGNDSASGCNETNEKIAHFDPTNYETHDGFRKKIVREYDSSLYATSDNRKLVQKTIQNVYAEQLEKQRTMTFNAYLEKHCFLLSAYRNSFLAASLYYKHVNATDSLTDDGGAALTTRYYGETTASDLPKNIDEIVPFSILFPLSGTDMEGEESLLYNTQYGIPDIANIIKKVQFWTKNTYEELCAIAKAFDKSLNYRSQCRAMAEKTKDTCKNDLVVYSFFKHILWLTVTGGYVRKYAQKISSSLVSNVEERFGRRRSESNVATSASLINTSMEEGRFFNRTVIPSFYACLILFDKIFNHESGIKRVLDFIKPQKIFSQHIWRENLIHFVHDQPHLRITQPYLNWSSFENSTDFATNCYRANLDDALLLNRTSNILKRSATCKNDDNANNNDDADNVNLYTENVKGKLDKNEDADQIDKKLHYEKSFERMKKMSKIHAFTKEDFAQEITSRMTVFQDRLIIYEMELRENIRDLEKIKRMFTNRAVATALIASEKKAREDDNYDDDTIERVTWFNEGASLNDLKPLWNEETKEWTFNVVHDSAKCSYEEHKQKIAKRILEFTVRKTNDFSFPKCCTIVDDEFSDDSSVSNASVDANCSCRSELSEPERRTFVVNPFEQQRPSFEGYVDVLDFLTSNDSVVTLSMVDHYLSSRLEDLEEFKIETSLRDDTMLFLYDFAMREHNAMNLTPVEMEAALRTHLGSEGLEVYSELRALYPDKMKPKAINDILEKTEINVFYKLYYLFRMQQFANSIKLIPIDKTTAKNIDLAMKYRRYGILDDKETLPDSAYHVYITACCGKIATNISPESYGQSDISYNHSLGTLVCNKKLKKRASLFRLHTINATVADATVGDSNDADVTVMETEEDENNTIMDEEDDLNAQVLLQEQRLIRNTALPRNDEETTNTSNTSNTTNTSATSNTSTMQNAMDLEERLFGTSDASSIDASTFSSSTSFRPVKQESNAYASCPSNVYKGKRLMFVDPKLTLNIKNYDEKTKYKIAKREKRRRETLTCLNTPAWVVDLRGKRLIYKNRGKTSGLFGHCPNCAQFHEIDQKLAYGFMGYCCDQCKKTAPENYSIHRCSYCQVLIPERQHEYSIRLPIFDVNGTDKVVIRKPYCNYDVPKRNDYYQPGYASSFLNTPPPRTSNAANNGQKRPQTSKSTSSKRIVLDTEILPNIFLDIHEGKILVNKSTTKYKKK